MPAQKTGADCAPVYYTQPEVERAYRLSSSFLEHDRTLAVPKIPYVKVGRAVRYRLSDVEAAMSRMTVGAPA